MFNPLAYNSIGKTGHSSTHTAIPAQILCKKPEHGELTPSEVQERFVEVLLDLQAFQRRITIATEIVHDASPVKPSEIH